MVSLLLLVLSAPAAISALEQQQQQHEAVQAAANPIRKVVTMLQDMQKKVTEEGAAEADLYEKFMCYCKTSGGTLSSSIVEAKNSIASLTTSLTASGEKKAQTVADEKEHQQSRSEAKDAMAKATALREKEASDFAKEESDSNANIAALKKAIAAVEKGMVGGFLQSTDATKLRSYTMEKAELSDEARQELLAFLSGTQSLGYVPQSGQISGILQQIKDEMTKSLAAATATEQAAIQSYEALMAAKRKEVEVLTGQIEEEQARIGELGVQIASMSNDLEDTKESLGADTEFLAQLDAGCDKKTQEWEVIKQTRADELVALAETIKVLNDDDALELFKKTLPSASASFVQFQTKTASLKARALAALRSTVARRTLIAAPLPARPELDLIELALNGRKIGFDKVVSMIDEMIAQLLAEQREDDSKKEYCGVQFDSSDDKKKGLQVSISDSETAIEEMKGSIATLTEEIAALESGIKALDKSVAEATAQRKSENEDYTKMTTETANAKKVLNWAKNRLYKYYEPKMYKAPPKRDLSEEQTIVESFGGTLAPTPAPGGIAGTGIGAALVQVSEHKHGKVAPPPPPETFGAYTKKTRESAGVIEMMDILIKDLDKQLTEADTAEKEAQKEYEAMMAQAAKKRADDAKSVADKTAAKAAEEEALQAETETKAGTTKDLAMTLKYIQSLHSECDWLVKYYDVRKEARASEVDSLRKAKAVLNGADYSFVQTGSSASNTGFLRRH